MKFGALHEYSRPPQRAYSGSHWRISAHSPVAGARVPAFARILQSPYRPQAVVQLFPCCACPLYHSSSALFLIAELHDALQRRATRNRHETTQLLGDFMAQLAAPTPTASFPPPRSTLSSAFFPLPLPPVAASHDGHHPLPARRQAEQGHQAGINGATAAAGERLQQQRCSGRFGSGNSAGAGG